MSHHAGFPAAVRTVGLFCALALGGCSTVQFGSSPLLSAQTPPATGPVGSAQEPQPEGSLPPNADTAGWTQNGVGATQTNYGSLTFKP